MISGKEFRALRKNKGLTLKDVAKVLNTSEQAVNKYELEIVRNIPLDRVEAMAKLYGVSPSYIMGWESLFPESDVDSLFVGKYGHDSFDLVQKYQQLDSTDRIRLQERADTLLEDDKYKGALSGERAI